MNEIEQIKQKIDIVELINDYIPLKKSGRNFKSPCPFHSEKTPSFTVSAERQIWHCFGCGKGGDIFTFLTEYEHADFPEALKILAARAGVKLTTTPFRTDQEKKKDMIYTLNSLAAQFYHYVLTSHPAGKKALKYLEERKVGLPLIDTFNLGFAPTNPRALTAFLTKKGYNEQQLIDAGLSTRRGRDAVDFFYNRVIFTIYDTRGNIIAFSARTLDNTTLPKYVNTKETLVYKKGDTLYGMNVAKDAIKKEGRAILVEGEFDVISSFREGIANTVAVKGTALTENQIRLLKRFAPKISFCFDTDPAGTEAQRRSISLIEKEGIQASVIIPPQGKDPDEILRENPLLFQKAVKKDTNIYDFIIDSAVSSHNTSSAEGKKRILEKTLPYLTIIDNEVLKEHYFKKLANEIDASLESVMREADKIISKKPDITEQVARDDTPREELVERYLFALTLQSEDVAKSIEIVKENFHDIDFITPALARLFSALTNFTQENKIFDANKFAKALPSELQTTYDTLLLFPIQEFKDGEAFRHEFLKVIQDTKLLALKHAMQKVGRDISVFEKKGDEEELNKAKEKFIHITRLLAFFQKETQK